MQGGRGKAMIKKLEKKKKELFEFTQNGLFTQPSLKMTSCCPDVWTCAGSWDDHLDSLLAGVGCPPAACLVHSWDSSLLSSACFLCCYCAVFLELFDFCFGFFPGSQAICSEFLLETEPVFLCLIGGANR